MQIPLQQFENYIDEAILKRGLSYFRKGAVNDVEEISPGQFEAIVSGNDDYTVHLRISGDIITEHWCNCPYDLGPVCKHIVAVLFHMQQEEMELNQPRKKKPTAGKPSKKKTVEEQVLEIIRRLSHDDLKQFILEQATGNATFRQSFISGFAHLVSGESKEMYKKQLRSIITGIERNRGYVDWSGAAVIGKAVDNLLLSAQKHLDQNHFQSVIYIACAVMEEMTPLLQYADDSDGAIGGPIENAFELLNLVTQSKIPDNLRLDMLDYCLTTFDKRTFKDWDWHLGLLELATNLANTEPEGDRILALVDKTKGSAFEKEQAQLIKYSILSKVKGTKAAEDFMTWNLSNSRLRTIAIETAIKDKKYEKAIEIALDGVRFDAKESPGLVRTWQEWLLKIAILQKDTNRVIEYARILFVDSNSFHQDYYRLLKSNLAQGLWKDFAEGLVTDIQKRSRWHLVDQIAGIYIQENWWDRLFELLIANPSLRNIETFEKYLASGYSSELVEMYSKGIVSLLERSSSRNDYKEACRYLRRIIKLGAKDKCDDLILKITAGYPRRSALLDELSRV